MGAKDSPLPMSEDAQIYIQNQEVDKAVFEVFLSSAPKVKESLTFVLVALFVVVFGLLFMLMQAVAPKAAIKARREWGLSRRNRSTSSRDSGRSVIHVSPSQVTSVV